MCSCVDDSLNLLCILKSIVHCFCYAFCLHSLLDILADRKGGGGITGDIIVNGEPRPRNFRYASGYVPQVSLCYNGILFTLHVAIHWALMPCGR